MLWTWQNGDVGAILEFDGNHVKAPASITAKTLVKPAERDLYFPAADEEYEVSRIPNAQLRVTPGIWGHFAGSGGNPEDTKFIENAMKELLSAPVTSNSNDSSDLSHMHISA
ncbi:hypothetical protein WJX77_006415 [Trebouxia sp. C0004]